MEIWYTYHAERRALERGALERGAPVLALLPEDAVEVPGRTRRGARPHPSRCQAAPVEVPGRTRRADCVVFEFRDGGRRWHIVLLTGDVTYGAVVLSLYCPDDHEPGWAGAQAAREAHSLDRLRHRLLLRHRALAPGSGPDVSVFAPFFSTSR